MATTNIIDVIQVAKVGKTYGLNGLLFLYPLSYDIEEIISYKSWYIKLDDKSSWSLLEREEIFKSKDNKVFISFYDSKNKEDSKKYVNAKIGILKQDFKTKFSDDEFYHFDLISCKVINQEKKFLGFVSEILETKVNEVLIIKEYLDRKCVEILIPFVEPYIKNIDIENKIISVYWEEDF